MRFARTVCAAGFILFAAELAAQNEIRHPDADNLRDPPGTRYLSRADTLSPSTTLMALARRMRDLTTAPFGEAEFGRIADVVVRDGKVAVADQGFHQVAVLDSTGANPIVIGQYGSGPLDFRSLVAVELRSSSELLTYDAVLGLKTIGIANQAAPRLHRIVPPRVSALSACLHTRLPILLAPSALMPGAAQVDGATEPLLMAVDSSGTPVRRFGESYKSVNPLVRRMMSEAVIGCSSREDVVLGYVSLPYVRVYGADGRLKHTLRLRDFVQAVSLERRDSQGRNSIGIDPNTREFSQVRRVVEVAAEILAVQVLTLRAAARRGIVPVRTDTYLVSATSGEAVYVGDHLPLLAASDGFPTVGYVDDPEPALLRLVPRGDSGIRRR